jgi:hypothetical protein
MNEHNDIAARAIGLDWVSRDGKKRTPISEAGLSRVWQHIEDPNRSFAVISPNKAMATPEENKNNYMALVHEVHDVRKLGYLPLESGYTYQEGELAGKSFAESSILIPNISKEDALELGNQFGQETIIWKDRDEFSMLRCKDGSVDLSFKAQAGRDLLTFDEENVKHVFSKLVKGRASQRDKKFAFVVESLSAWIFGGTCLAMGGYWNPEAKVPLLRPKNWNKQ